MPAKLFLPYIPQSDFAFFTNDQRQPEPGMFGAKLTSDTTKGPACRGDEIIFLAVYAAALFTHEFSRLMRFLRPIILQRNRSIKHQFARGAVLVQGEVGQPLELIAFRR